MSSRRQAASDPTPISKIGRAIDEAACSGRRSMCSMSICIATRAHYSVWIRVIDCKTLVKKPGSNQFLVTEGGIELGASLTLSFPSCWDFTHSIILQTLTFRPDSGINHANDDTVPITWSRPRPMIIAQAKELGSVGGVELKRKVWSGGKVSRGIL